jgi:S-adenosylhomocysteine hydrolase
VHRPGEYGDMMGIDYDVKDMALADKGLDKVEWAEMGT